jgi:hypothetical protein
MYPTTSNGIVHYTKNPTSKKTRTNKLTTYTKQQRKRSMYKATKLRTVTFVVFFWFF